MNAILTPSATHSLPFAFLHGFAGRASQWDEVRRALGDPPAIALQIAGHEGPPPHGTFVHEVDRLATELQRAGALPGSLPCHLVGYSLGGRLALGLLARHPQLFARATILGAHPGLADEDERDRRRLDDDRWARRLEQDGLDAFLDAWQRRPLFARTQGAAHHEALRRLRRGLAPEPLAASLRSLSLAAMPQWDSALRRSHLPITFVAGEEDEKFLGLARHMADLTARGQVEVVPGAGHNLPLEAPVAVAEILRRPTLSKEHPEELSATNPLLSTLPPLLQS